jgi:hypothetical protein
MSYILMRVIGDQMLRMVAIMVFLKVIVNGLNSRMVGLRYDGVLTILVTDIKSLA